MIQCRLIHQLGKSREETMQSIVRISKVFTYMMDVC